MAEIRVENKRDKNRSIWPWILGALLLIGLIWGITRSSDDEREIEANRIENTTIDNGEARPTAPERVNNDQYEDSEMMEEDQMKDEPVMEDEAVLENE